MACAMERYRTCKCTCGMNHDDVMGLAYYVSFFTFSPKTGFQVETDKGFNFSLVDDSFVCQKKNHFQVTVTVVFHRTPKFLKLKVVSKWPCH